MKKRGLRRIALALIAALVFTAIPMAVSAASNAPGKAKITYMKAGRVNSKKCTATVTVKWNKVKNARGYEIYEKCGDSKWVRLKSVGKLKRSIRIKGVPTGKYYVKIRAIRKLKGKTYKGKFSKVKSIFIKCPISLEKYVKTIRPEIKKEINKELKDKGSISFKGNKIILKSDLSKDPDITADMVNSLTASDKKELYNELGSFKKDANKLKATMKKNTGVSNVGVTLKFVYKSKTITSRSF